MEGVFLQAQGRSREDCPFLQQFADISGEWALYLKMEVGNLGEDSASMAIRYDGG